MDMLQALRADQWRHVHPEAPEAQRRQIELALRNAFYIDTNDWKHRVIDQAVEAAQEALNGLGG